MIDRRLRLAAIAAVLGLLVAWVAIDWWGGRRVSREVARLEGRFGSLDGRSIAAPNVPAQDNRALAVHAAALLINPGSQGSDTYTAAGRFRLQPDPAGVPDDIRAFADGNQEAIRVAALALNRRQSSWQADYAGSGTLPPWLAIRRLSQVLYASARIDLAAGRPDDAAARLAVGLAVAASIRQEPTLIGQLIRVHTAVEQCDGIARVVATSEPSKEALERLAYWLNQNREVDPIETGLRAELRWGNAMFTTIAQGRATEIWGRRSAWLKVGRVARPIVRLAHARYLRQMERLIDHHARPLPRQALTGIATPATRSWRRLSDEPILGLQRAMESGHLFDSALAVTRIGVALRRYRVDHGAYPADLATLVPGYLGRLPLDPLTGHPPVYARVNAGFTLKADTTGRSSTDKRALEWTVSK